MIEEDKEDAYFASPTQTNSNYMQESHFGGQVLRQSAMATSAHEPTLDATFDGPDYTENTNAFQEFDPLSSEWMSLNPERD